MTLLASLVRPRMIGALWIASTLAAGCGAQATPGGADPGSAGTGAIGGSNGDQSGGGATGGGDVAPAPAPPPASRCTVGPTVHDIECSHESATIGGRSVLWQTPLGLPPPTGWPLAVIYQGSLLSPDGSAPLEPHGMWKTTATDAASDGIFADYALAQLTTQTTVIKQLLDGGYAVVTPTADTAGFAWDTNLPPWDVDWPPAPDSTFLTALFAAISGGQLGPVSATRWYATGISSGGFMTSRMAVSYDGRFRALAIAAGSYATCGGVPICTVPALPTDHPPTLFLHGAQDPLVPLSQMYAYYDALVTMGGETKAIVDANTKHGWIPESPGAIVSWFDSHP